MHNAQSPRPENDETHEQEILRKGLTAPRITPADVENAVASEYYFTASEGVHGHDIAGIRALRRDQVVSVASVEAVGQLEYLDGPLKLLTFCVLVLRNGFTVTGESACASPENFDAELGRRIARTNATQKIWALEGYRLKQSLYEAHVAGYLPATTASVFGET